MQAISGYIQTGGSLAILATKRFPDSENAKCPPLFDRTDLATVCLARNCVCRPTDAYLF
jgi:hypothetical protein